MTEIIRAQPEEAGQLSAIAWAAKAHWGYPARWMHEWRGLLTITPEFICENETFIALTSGERGGFYALVETDGGLSLEHLWVMPTRIGQGLGRALFQHSVERAAARGAARLTIAADPHAQAFYLHLGASRVGSVQSAVDGRVRELPLLAFDLRKAR